MALIWRFNDRSLVRHAALDFNLCIQTSIDKSHGQPKTVRDNWRSFQLHNPQLRSRQCRKRMNIFQLDARMDHWNHINIKVCFVNWHSTSNFFSVRELTRLSTCSCLFVLRHVWTTIGAKLTKIKNYPDLNWFNAPTIVHSLLLSRITLSVATLPPSEPP